MSILKKFIDESVDKWKNSSIALFYTHRPMSDYGDNVVLKMFEKEGFHLFGYVKGTHEYYRMHDIISKYGRLIAREKANVDKVEGIYQKTVSLLPVIWGTKHQSFLFSGNIHTLSNEQANFMKRVRELVEISSIKSLRNVSNIFDSIGKPEDLNFIGHFNTKNTTIINTGQTDRRVMELDSMLEERRLDLEALRQVAMQEDAPDATRARIAVFGWLRNKRNYVSRAMLLDIMFYVVTDKYLNRVLELQNSPYWKKAIILSYGYNTLPLSAYVSNKAFSEEMSSLVRNRVYSDHMALWRSQGPKNNRKVAEEALYIHDLYDLMKELPKIRRLEIVPDRTVLTTLRPYTTLNGKKVSFTKSVLQTEPGKEIRVQSIHCRVGGTYLLVLAVGKDMQVNEQIMPKLTPELKMFYEHHGIEFPKFLTGEEAQYILEMKPGAHGQICNTQFLFTYDVDTTLYTVNVPTI